MLKRGQWFLIIDCVSPVKIFFGIVEGHFIRLSYVSIDERLSEGT